MRKARLEVDKLPNLHAKTVGNATKKVDSHAYGSVFDMPDMRLVGARHQSKLALGEALPLPFPPYGGTEQFSAFA